MRTTLFFLLNLSIMSLSAQSDLLLHSGWEFRSSDSREWLPAVVPGSVHTDLVRAGAIPQPFFGTNEDSVQWIEEKDWEYQLTFTVPDSVLSKENARLVFDGLDTYAEVMLNGELILRADNMHRAWKVDVKDFLQTENTLLIRFTSPIHEGKRLSKDIPFRMPVDERIFTRKAQYQYGWDWGPRLVGCGIWQPVRLETWSSTRIENIHIQQKSLQTDFVELEAQIHWKLPEQGKDDSTHYSVQVWVDGQVAAESKWKISGVPDAMPVVPFTIANPQRWWPRGMGDAHLYQLEFRLYEDQQLLQTYQLNYGLRTVELVQDADAVGSSFYFKVNGKPIFAKGANFIPTNSFPEQTTREDYRSMLEDIATANVNMLRIWGGGIYEQDYFYELCDSLGIMVWQDFMFACAMYPGDSAFMANVAAEVDYQVRRLRNHPSIVMWCGNNEIDEAWHNWGWQITFGYLQLQADQIWGWYKQLFHQLIPYTLAALDPSRPYWPSSPSIGWGKKESLLQGDAHYLGVWWGKEPLDVYHKKVGRFMSEYGFQGMPSLFTLQEYMDSSDLHLYSPAIKQHQKHQVGYETIQTYMERDFPVPESFEDYVYVSQLLQAWGIRHALDAHLSAMPYCMGTLFWQWNDCWPVTSWSATDVAGRRKALYYQAKRSFGDYHLSAKKNKQGLDIWLTCQKPLGSNTPQLMLFGEKPVPIMVELDTDIPHDSTGSFLLAHLDAKALTGWNQLAFNLGIPGWTVEYETVLFIDAPNKSALQPVHITYTYDSLRQALYLKSDGLAWGVYICTEDEEISLSDNFFDMNDYWDKVVYLENVPPDFDGTVRIRTLNELMTFK